ncbi:MAG: hypothetical protein K2O47_06330 [Muribaculaceae bacterium]|nr:hypothetical protein [Muribaculaceae bacterium]
MKKTLLSIAAVAVTAFSGMANEYKFVFDGNNDMGGLTRQTSIKEAELSFAESFSMTEEGVELSVKKVSENGLGLALINAGGLNAGLCVYSSTFVAMTPEISLKVPNGKITSVTITMSGSGLTNLDVSFNGKEIECDGTSQPFFWKWSDAEGTDEVICTWVNNYFQRFIHSIEVVYTPDLGGKQECGLSFDEKSLDGVIGEEFTAPVLNNPNNLEVTWTSSDTNIATVEAGKVTLVGNGTVVITAATAGNDEFAAGNAKYEICVIPSATNIADLIKYAPEVGDRVKINFPATVNFGYGSVAYVTDSEGNAACFDDLRNRNSQSTSTTTIYKAGQVIPAGWIATNATVYEDMIWSGLPDKSTETVEVVYAKVTSISPADANKVVTLENVTFEKRTAEGSTKAYGTTPDGTRYEFQDTFGTESQPAGTYDVTGVVKYSKRGSTEYFYMIPVKYSEPAGSAIEGIDAIGGNAVYYNMNGVKVTDPVKGVYVKVIDGKASKVVVK